MATTSLVSVVEYLSTSYSPDREYVDGVVVERNVGELSHSTVQRELTIFLGIRHKELGIWVYPEQRVQVTPTRYRVPDLCVVAGRKPQEQILTPPPFLCIEILSKDDRAGETQEKIDDYLACGVPYVWVVDPERRRGYIHTAGGSREAKDGILRTEDPNIALPLAEIFAEL
jgi:Uma2 family endonuclease